MRTCMPRPPPILQMHTIVEQPLTLTSKGKILCQPIGQEPIQFVWHSPDGRSQPGGSEATGLNTGRHRIEAVDGTDARAIAVVDVRPVFPNAVVVEGYRVTPASTTLSRDGSVEALGHGTKDVRFMWTNGVETEGPMLRDVACGTYAAVPVVDVPTVILARPAFVAVSTDGRWGRNTEK